MENAGVSTASFKFQSALHFSLVELSRLQASAFEGYFVTVPDDPVMLSARFRAEQVDLAASFVAFAADEPVGLCFVARRGRISRIAGMGVMKTWRGRGVGGAIMRHALEQARGRGDLRVTLEVIEQNAGAVRLYGSLGFLRTAHLRGYEAESITPIPAALEEITVADFVACMGGADAGLPWQLQSATLAASAPPVQAFRLGQAACLVSIHPQTVMLRALWVPDSARRQGHATRLLQALAHAFPKRRWNVVPIVPAEVGDGFLLSRGFTHSALSQFEMVRKIG